MASQRAIMRAIEQVTKQIPADEAEALPPTIRSARESLKRGRGGPRARARGRAARRRPLAGGRNTIGVGMGFRIKDGKLTNERVLQFYVVKKVKDKRRLRADEVVPEVVTVGREPVPTDVIEVGRVTFEKLATRSPVQPGYSIGHPDITAGTLGAVVRRGKAYAALSNCHVLAAAGNAEKGDVILYPGPADGGRAPNDVVGKLTAFRKFVVGGTYPNRVDAAVATFAKPRLKDVRSDIRGLGLPRGTIAPRLGMKVTKTGRTTGTTQGTVIGLAARLEIDFEDVGIVGFRDQVLCTRYTDGGDSGSLVLDRKTKKAVGLHFAGGPRGSFFTPIGTVLSAMGSTLVTTQIKNKKK